MTRRRLTAEDWAAIARVGFGTFVVVLLLVLVVEMTLRDSQRYHQLQQIIGLLRAICRSLGARC